MISVMLFTRNICSAQQPVDTLEISGMQYPVLMDEAGRKYVQCYKLNGKPYRCPIWEKTGEKFEGQDVYKYKRNGYFYYGISRHGYPMYVWLIKQPKKKK